MSKKEAPELRSPHIRRILDRMPAGLTLAAVIVSLLIIAGVIAAACLLPYPHSGGESILQHIMGYNSN